MKRSTSNLTRCLALVMALVLLVSNANLGVALQAFAVEDGKTTVNAGEVVANNYELTEAEENLLKSGFLKGEVTYTTFDATGLVAVDTEQKTITAKNFNGWVPTTATIVVGEETKETIVLSEGNTYTYGGNAFAVKVAYTLDVNVDNQDALLKAAGTLKNALDTMKAVYAVANTNLGTVVLAMPILVDLITGYQFDFFGRPQTLKLGEDAAAAVEELNAQMAERDGKLNMQVTNLFYNGANSKVQFLVENGEFYKQDVVAIYEALAAIAADPMMNNDMLDAYLGQDEANYTKWVTLKGILGELVAGLKPAATTDWVDVSAVKADLTGEEYVALDALVNAVAGTTAVTAKNPLHIGDAVAQANLSMFNVTVDVKLYTVDEENELVENETVQHVVLTLAKGATHEEIQMAIMESGVMADAEAAWGEAFVAGKYIATGSDLPEALTEDITYTITYNPVNYTITFGEGFVGEEAKTVPYGYQLELAKHADAAQAYDYYVNGELKTQGSIVVIENDTTVTRSAGKAYDTMTLYGVIADNYANDVLKAILNSGALNGNVSIALRKPDAADSESLVNLSGNKLTAVAEYGADYNGLSWTPASYGENGTEHAFGSSYTVDWIPNTAKVQYVLVLDNFSEEQVAKILADAAALKAQAADQVAVLNDLATHGETLAQLNLTMLGGLSGTIKYSTLNADPEKNAALKAEFTDILENKIIPNNVDANEKLKIYNMIMAYSAEGTGGLSYYYNNSKAILNEIASLTQYLDGMTNDEDKLNALVTLATNAGFPEYADQIFGLKDLLADFNARLTAPSDMIDLSSPNLYVLLEVLESAGNAETTGSGSPYLISETLTAVDDSVAIVQVKVTAGGKTESFTTGELVLGEASFTSAEFDKLCAAIEAFANSNIEDAALYEPDGFEALSALVGQELTQKQTNVTITYVPTGYSVFVEDEDGVEVACFTVSVNNRQITLPKHDKLGFVYEYDVFGKIITAAYDGEDAKITLSVEQIREIAAGTDVIVRKEINKAQEDLDDSIENATTLEWIEDAEGNKTGLIASVDASEDGAMAFVTELLGLGYSYVEVSDEVLMQTVTDTEISLQALVNAMLKDNTFGSHTLIELGKNGKGTVLNGTISLGKGADNIYFEDLDFVFKMTTVPAEMKDIADGLEAVKEYMSFRSNNGKLDVSLNLPSEVYDIYLAALLGACELDKTNINAINNEIAFMFLGDYIATIINSDANTTTFQNTLDMLVKAANEGIDATEGVVGEIGSITNEADDILGEINGALNEADQMVNSSDVKDIDLTEYEEYYQMVKAALKGDGFKYEFVTINDSGKDVLAMDATAVGKDSIDALMALLGVTPSDLGTALSMIKEYKEGEEVNLSVVTYLENTYVNYEAALLDVDQFNMDDPANSGEVFTFTSNLSQRVKDVTGGAVVILMDDVNGDLVFPSVTVLDLNGKTVNGNIRSNGKLIIIDSTLNTYSAGTVTGSLSGDIDILAGNYSADVSGFLPSGYKQEGTTVRNAMYTFSASKARSAGQTFDINIDTDFINQNVENYAQYVACLASELTVDFVANYYARAALSLNGNLIYDFEFHDFVGFICSDSKPEELVNKILDCYHLPETANFINGIIEDLLDYCAMKAALEAGEPISTFSTTTAPWEIDVVHITDGDYITFCLDTCDKNANTITYNLRFSGAYVDEMVGFAAYMDEIVEDETCLRFVGVEDLVFVDHHFVLVGGAESVVSLDLTDSTAYIAIVMAYCAEDAGRAAEFVNALNNGDNAALKAAFDKITVDEVVQALKVLQGNETFASMSEATGITVKVEAEAGIEEALFYALSGIGWALNDLDVDGTDGKLGELESVYGIYGFENVGNSDVGGISEYGYGIKYKLTAADFTLKIKLFEEEDCLWGDANHDGIVDGNDATLVLQYELGIAPDIFCTVRTDVNGNGTIDGDDATLILQYELGIITKFPAEN